MKKDKWLNALWIVLILAFALAIVGCASINGGLSYSINKALNERWEK